MRATGFRTSPGHLLLTLIALASGTAWPSALAQGGGGGGRGGRGGRGAQPPAAEQQPASALPAGKRALKVDDMYRVRSVRDPQISPEGDWIAYVVGTLDSTRDRSNSDIYTVRWDGSRTVQMTYTPEGEGSPRWSPDGKYLSFVASRGDARSGSQIWLLDRTGGEAHKLTDLKTGVGEYEWSPDSKRILIVAQDTEPSAQPPGADTSRAKTPKPIVIDRYHFKQDVTGYLGNRRSHIYVFDLDTKKTEQLTSGRFSESNASWSPEGKYIAFVSERSQDPDRSNDSNIYMMESRVGAEQKQLTTWNGPDGGRPAWSPDGKWIAYLQGSEPQYEEYSLNKLAIVSVDGGTPRILTASLDRPVSQPEFTKDGTGIYCLVADDRTEFLARVNVADGAVSRVVEGKRVVSDVVLGPSDKVAVLTGTESKPNEIYAVEKGTLRALTHENDAWLADVVLGTMDDFSARTKDGSEVHGLLIKPPTYKAGTRYPTLLRIHGGPNGQDAHSFNFERELFAANGYAVIHANYRGSNGRGADYQKAIFADWGNKEVLDLQAAVDYAISSGVADSTRLGVGGWSYGGILTDYMIASTTRFRAATSGAGVANVASFYGIDQYIYQYDFELGPPWKNQDVYLKLSYPFWHADKIKTPTLFLGGEKDFNVPVNGGEQMYQALKSLGLDTQLIIYPNSFHGITTPSYQKDRYERYLAWYSKYLRPAVQP
jgi:dipeptidyl aminopeptidase/acylaminoacyl peptidase